MSITGLDVIVRYSLPEVRNSSVNVDHVGPMVTYLYPDADERNWSWSYLRGQFSLKNLDNLFALYRRRIQHSLFTVMLFIHIVYSLIRIIALLVLIESGNIIPTLSFHLLSSIFSGTCLYLAIRDKGSRFTRSNLVPALCSGLLLILIEISDYSFIVFNKDLLDSEAQAPRLSPTFTIIIVSYVFLPFPKLYQAVIAGFCLAILDLTIAAVIIEDPHKHTRQFVADCILYLTANIFGMYKVFLDELNQRRSFLDHRRCIESSIRLEYEEGREIKLMESILPNYIAQDVLKELRTAVKNYNYTSHPTKNVHRPFSSLFLKTHDHVSILFSDIVNFTQLAASLKTEDLVELLNELFGRFDDIAKVHDCMRIRILGDCYIAVSGIPDFTPQHARNCVTMALDIINVISDLREERKVDVGMRIGVHSGKVMCGLLGMRKWQFDIWSGDVNVANILEQTGQPGMVHVSNVTLKLLDGSWLYKDRGLVRDNIEKYLYLKRQGIDTYLVLCEQLPEREANVSFSGESHMVNGTVHAGFQRHRQRRNSKTQKQRRGSNTSLQIDIVKRRRTVLETSSLVQFQKMIKNVDEKMEVAINGMALSKRDQWTKKSHVRPLLLRFADSTWEMPFLKQLDPLFKYYLLFSAFIFAIIFTITMLIFFSDNAPLVAAYVVVAPIFILIVYIAWHNFFMNLRIKKDKDGFPPVIVPKSQQKKWKLRRLLDSASQAITVSLRVRLILLVTVTMIIAIFAFFDMSACIFTGDFNCLLTPSTNDTSAYSLNEILDPRFITQNVALTLTAIAAFIRIHFLIKLTMYILVLALYITFMIIGGNDGVHWQSSIPGQNYQYCNSSLKLHSTVSIRSSELPNLHVSPSFLFDLRTGFPWEQFVSILFFSLCLHLMDRQSEYLSRLDYSWKNQLRDEQDKAILSRMVNKILLQNILPVHVADIYLNENMQDTLYHEEYQCVAVMFASIPEFSEFYNESEVTDSGKNCLLVLGEIIKEMDELLYKSEFLNVEKIKVIGSTYLAAVGLRPGRKNSNEESMSPYDDQMIATTMVTFAVAMMDALDTYNTTAWPVGFQFRIGIEMGHVTAGIIGAQKPLYDIWGDTVNVASRMESHGELGRIHVTENFAQILSRSKMACQCRGMMDIKGKGFLTTYFVITERDQRPEITRL